MRKLPKNLIKVIKKAQADPGVSVYEISKSLGIGYRRVHESLARAESLGLLRSDLDLYQGRCVRKVFPVEGLERLAVEKIQVGRASELQRYSHQLTTRLFRKYSGVTYRFAIDEKPRLSIIQNNDPMSAW